MSTLRLKPTLDILQQEYVLVQAWKKTHDYVRAHNWYADVLELDLSNTRLPNTLKHLQDELKNHKKLTPSPARLVLAPKSAAWEIRNGKWNPKKGDQQKLRPLAHLPIRDQTLATAFMLCMADRIETAQGNPIWNLTDCRNKKMVSYGHRLLCDYENSNLNCRWGNAVFYRGYFEDYQKFIRRPDEVVRSDFPTQKNWAIVQADLSQFYDRVRPEQLFKKVVKIFKGEADEAFLATFQRLFHWSWHSSDLAKAKEYASTQTPIIKKFDQVALPQGLAASGFFANLFLLDLDAALCNLRHHIQKGGWKIVDYCRYVDDIRLVLELPNEKQSGKQIDSATLKTEVTNLIQKLASEHAPGMLLNPAKTDVLFGKNEASRLLAFSDTMTTIQQRVSGAMDLAGGIETLTMIEGLFAAEPEESPLVKNSKDETTNGDSFFSTVRDVKDETVARFSANRFKKTFRSTRVLTSDSDPKEKGAVLTKAHLDHRAAYFAQRLVWRWVKDPSNVRLLRISLDLNADPNTAKKIIDLIRPHIFRGKSKSHKKHVVQYCAAELFKTAATEIGLDIESIQMPDKADPLEVQRLFAAFAEEIINAGTKIPWYLAQQALLLLAVSGQALKIKTRKSKRPEWHHYLVLHEFLQGKISVKSPGEIVQFTLAARCFDKKNDDALKLLAKWLSHPFGMSRKSEVVKLLLEEDLNSGERLWPLLAPKEQERFYTIFTTYGIGSNLGLEQSIPTHATVSRTVAQIKANPINPFQHEYLALNFLKQVITQEKTFNGQLTPWTVNISADWNFLNISHPGFLESRFNVQPNIPAVSDAHAYKMPLWLSQQDHWRYRAGQILRALVVGRLDYTTSPIQKKPGLRYQPYRSHWYRRRYGLFNGRQGLGPDWLPISSWFCSLLSRLLAWPGFALEADETELSDDLSKEELLDCVDKRLDFLKSVHGKSSQTPIITHGAILKTFKGSSVREKAWSSFRIAVIQTVVPECKTLLADPELAIPENRDRQRAHLSSALAALSSMLRLRETHQAHGDRLNLLILPELSVHVDDVDTFLVPFARQHRCMVFAGLVYHRLQHDLNQPLVNAGIWLLPTETKSGSLRLERIKQGKCNLAPNERHVPQLSGWRPCQHLIQLRQHPFSKPIWTFTGSICYDATDLALASDLRNLSDTWVVPALNNSVQRFDTMVAALHYHMFQHVILCNSGEFGGSTAQAPFDEIHKRTIFHHHGNAQAAITFLELELDQYRAARNLNTPPAGVTRHGLGNI